MTWGDLEYRRSARSRYEDLANANARDASDRLRQQAYGGHLSKPLSLSERLENAMSELEEVARGAPGYRDRIDAISKQIAVLADEIDQAKRRKQLEKAPGCIRAGENK